MYGVTGGLLVENTSITHIENKEQTDLTVTLWTFIEEMLGSNLG